MQKISSVIGTIVFSAAVVFLGTQIAFAQTEAVSGGRAPIKEQSVKADVAKEKVLSPGIKSQEVKQLQQTLKSRGYYRGTVDASYGAKTQAAVKTFQTRAGIKPSGVASPETLTKLGITPVVETQTKSPVCDGESILTTYTPTRTRYWTDTALNASSHPEIKRYKIMWSNGKWSDWYIPGVNDTDWKDGSKKVWRYFDDHQYMIETCKEKIAPVGSSTVVGSVNPTSPVGESCSKVSVYSPTRSRYWTDTERDPLAHPEIKRYRIQWFNGGWSRWYTPGVNDVDWKQEYPDNLVPGNRLVWSYFDDHTYMIEGCDGFVMQGNSKALPVPTVPNISACSTTKGPILTITPTNRTFDPVGKGDSNRPLGEFVITPQPGCTAQILRMKFALSNPQGVTALVPATAEGTQFDRVMVSQGDTTTELYGKYFPQDVNYNMIPEGGSKTYVISGDIAATNTGDSIAVAIEDIVMTDVASGTLISGVQGLGVYDDTIAITD